jgi:predicted DsbA family dithiol-disulfide isomerase
VPVLLHRGRHFEQALAGARAEEEAPEIAWRWRPFQLQPELPAEGTDWRSFAERKFGSWRRAQATFRHVEEMGEAAGLAFRFDRMEKAVNTTDAHRLVLWAGAQDADGQKTGAQQRDGAAHSVAEALFAAYFTEGRDVGDAATLAQVAAESGLSADAAREMLASERFAEAVEESQREARRLGVTGVPFYLFDGDDEDEARAVSGAQPAAVFRRALAGHDAQAA